MRIVTICIILARPLWFSLSHVLHLTRFLAAGYHKVAICISAPSETVPNYRVSAATSDFFFFFAVNSSVPGAYHNRHSCARDK